MPTRPDIITSGDVESIGGRRYGLELVTQRYPAGPYTYAFLWIADRPHSLGAPVRGFGWPAERLDAALRSLFATLHTTHRA